MDIIAHRGFSGTYPENTMLSFEKAVENGADAIELDVHLSKDGEVMIIHDEALARTTGRDGFVFDYTRSELEKISAGKTKDDKFGFTPIPSLEEYLAMIKDTKLYTNIELKTAPVYYPGIEEKTLDLVRRFSLEDRILYSSFNWLSVLRMKDLELVILPCELVSAFGRQIKKTSTAACCLVWGYANGQTTYVVEASQFNGGHDGIATHLPKGKAEEYVGLILQHLID